VQQSSESPDCPRNQQLSWTRVAGVRPSAGAHDLWRHKILDRSLIKRSKIFGVEIHSRFDTKSVEIGLEPLVGPRAAHVVKMLEEIPIGV
jgi:hypothetical protein